MRYTIALVLFTLFIFVAERVVAFDARKITSNDDQIVSEVKIMSTVGASLSDYDNAKNTNINPHHQQGYDDNEDAEEASVGSGKVRSFKITDDDCLSHIHARDSPNLKFGTLFKSSCKFLPHPMYISSRCPSDDLNNLIASFPEEAKNLQRYVMFLAATHSGHSLIGSLLDAHPNMLVANEADIFSRYIGSEKAQYPKTRLEGREEIFDDILSNSLKCALFSRYQRGYNYTVPNGWGGHWMPGKLYVIGDKKGGSTSMVIEELLNKEGTEKMLTTFQEFQQTIGLPVHIIHVYWKKDEGYRRNDGFIKILQEGMSSSKFSASEWDNSVYTCGDDASRRSLFFDTCKSLGVPCNSEILDTWASMANCRAAKKHFLKMHKGG